ncbi:aminopeptidase [Desulforhopalus singaporensis]|uniref:Leucyl aminopeptidase (Aminopeptidase T) n=1 Tax=Desulforhopalus singaporensis TaxID=91360 RepID=A0A1H0UE25_9BACT|nr:leucyl aminopeptidase [Desulforhopalus singaporensis]SDP64439.1 Leucyl aminopeptidase (aminopeptidase T) [Desulforhopalus singaporensis]
MQNLLMLKGAKTLVDICTKVQPNESVLIVTDMNKTSIAETIAAIVLDRGAEPMIIVMRPRDRAGQEPPDAIAEAMKAADVVFIPVGYSITHTHAVKNAAAAKSRIIVMTDFTEEMMIHGGLEADFESIKPICVGVAQKFERGNTIHLTSPGGTDLTMDITGRRGNALYCMVEPGEFSTVPTVEANVSPVEGSANGRIVADASIPYLGIGILTEPVIVDVNDGFITSIDGGRQAAILRENLANQNDPNVYNIAEIGTGLNPNCRMCGLMLEDEGVISTCHIGIGTSITLGGTVKAAVHYDLLMWEPKIQVDGVAVINGKEVLI